MKLLAVLFGIGVLFSTGHCSCEDHQPDHIDICHDVLQSLEDALVQDVHNLYRSRKAFFYAPNADPVLIMVIYNITFAKNITEEVLSRCTNEGNSTQVTLNKTTLIVNRWTSRGLYLWISPLILNYMQMMLPFFILRLIRDLRITQVNPEMDAFLWDGTFDLPTLNIALSINSLPCIPSKEILDSAVKDLTQFIKVYASHGSMSHAETLHNEDIGFVLSADNAYTYSQLTSINVCSYCYDIIGCVVLFFAHISNLMNRKTAASLPYYGNIMSSTFVIGGIMIVLEYLARVIHISTCKNIDIYRYWFNAAGLIPIFMVYSLSSLSSYIKWRKIGFKCVTFYVHILLYILHIYHYALPTFLLMLVHPTKIVAIVAYLIAFVYVSVIVFSITVVIYKQVKRQLNHNSCICIFRLWACIFSFYLLPYACIIPFLLFVLFLVVYMLLLNQSFSITSGPVYTILSLIPTAAISFITWMLKSKFFQLEEMKNAQSSTDRNELGTDNVADSEEERIPLLRVEENNASSESSPDHQDYGTTNTEDMGSETNC